jgi:FAD/FMN-containing dehydrogenase
MNVPDLHIKGNVYTDEATLNRFSRDASSYRIKPRIVVEPDGEEDVLKILEYTRKTGGCITCRSGGSGLSGAGVGTGTILNFKPLMNRVSLMNEGVIAQPGVVLDDSLKQIEKKGLMLPVVPSSSALCALGGNIGTRSTGPRTSRYGTIDSFVSSLKFITASGEVIDTREDLPVFLEKGLLEIQERYLVDTESRKIFESRPFIAGGYNIRAFSHYRNPRDLATHLLVGSIGTLGIVTEIRLKLLPLRPSQGTYVALLVSVEEMGEEINKVSELKPSAIEFVDNATMSHIHGRILKVEDSNIVGALIVEFDESTDQAKYGQTILESFNLSRLIEIPVSSKEETELWAERRRILPSLWAYVMEKGWIVPSIIDDMTLHLKDFTPIFKGLQKMMTDLGHEIAVFGHIGFGSLHARPIFNPQTRDVVKQIMEVSRDTFYMMQKYGGTLVGEHNAGRSRSVYLEMELKEAFHYLRDVKTLFDPDDILNPKTIFNLDPITSHMELFR